MTRGRFIAALDAAESVMGRIVKEAVASGLGDFTGSDMRLLAQRDPDLEPRVLLARRWVEAADAVAKLRDERNRRRSHHGSLNRIIEKA